MLYDVFAPEARAQRFPLVAGRRSSGRSARSSRASEKNQKKPVVAPRFEGVLAKPEALFFFADVRAAKLIVIPTAPGLSKIESWRYSYAAESA